MDADRLAQIEEMLADARAGGGSEPGWQGVYAGDVGELLAEVRRLRELLADEDQEDTDE